MKLLFWLSSFFGSTLLYAQSAQPQVEVSSIRVTLSQSICAPSDTIFFTLYNFETLNSDKKASEIFGLDIVNNAGRSVHHQKFRCINGIANSQIIIPGNLQGGYYLIHLYPVQETSNVKPFLKEICIVSDKVFTKKTKPAIYVGGEDGILVADAPNNLIIINNQLPNNKIALFEDRKRIGDVTLDGYGTANCKLTPIKGKSYRVQSLDSTFVYPIDIAQSGVTCKTKMVSDTIVISCTGTMGQSAQKQFKISIGREIQKLGNAQYLGSSETKIPLQNLPAGILYVMLHESGNAPRLIRAFYNSKGFNELELSAEKDTVNVRDLVSGSFNLNSKYDQNEVTYYCVKAVSMRHLSESRIKSFPISGLPYLPGYSFDTNLPGWENSLNNYLTMVKLPASTVRTSTIGNAGVNQYLSIQGRAINGSNGRPVPDSTLLVGFLERNLIGYETRTRKEGQFKMSIYYDFQDKDTLFVHAKNGSMDLRAIKLEIETAKPEFISADSYSETEKSDPFHSFAFNRKLTEESYSTFLDESPTSVTETDPNYLFEEEVGKIDFARNVHEFAPFPTMIELIKNIVPGLFLIGSGENTKVHVSFTSQGQKSPESPVFVIDGVFTKDMRYFLSLSPSEVVSIKIVRDLNTLSRFGELGKGGFIIVRTKVRKHAGLVESSSLVPVTGITEPILFRKPKNLPNVPSLKTLLLWESGVGSSGQFQFLLGDDLGPIMISVEAFTKSGKVLYAEKQIFVRP